MSAEYLSWVPADVDLTKPNPARVYDYMLGGANNFEVDRTFAKMVLERVPQVQLMAQENRAFLRRAVSFLAEQGVRQFLDLGSGIPTVGNTHEVVTQIQPNARVVYVDVEPVAVAHSELILQDNENAAVLRGDVRDARGVLNHPTTRRLLDFDEPVAILAFAVLHFVSDADDPHRLVATYRDATVPGSYLALSHAAIVEALPAATEVLDDYRRQVSDVTNRSKADVTRLFEGYDLVEPGVVFPRDWRPEIDLHHDYPTPIYGGVGQRI